MPAGDLLARSLSSWGILTTEEAAMMTRPTDLERARERQGAEGVKARRRVLWQSGPRRERARLLRGVGRLRVMGWR